jgi:hypothetical protein
MLFAGCGSGTVDEDAWARGLIVKIGPPPVAKWVQRFPVDSPLGR